jgi:hypothetical protein
MNGVWVTLLELEEVFVWSEAGGGPRVSPAGAALLVRLFEQNVFELGEPRSIPGGMELLNLYSKGLVTLLNASFSRKPRRSTRRASSRPKRAAQHSAAPTEEHVLSVRNPWVNATTHRLI